MSVGSVAKRYNNADPLEDILRQLQNQAHIRNTNTIKMDLVQITQTHGDKTPKNGEDITQINREVSKETSAVSNKKVPLTWRQ